RKTPTRFPEDPEKYGSQRRQHGREDLEPKVLLIAKPVGASLDDADLVVESLDEAECHLVFRFAVSRDPLPVALDHGGELLVGLEALPSESGAPVIEEAASPAFPLVVPELAEGLFQQVRRVEPLVRSQEQLQRLSALRGEVLSMAEEVVLLALDELPILAAQPCVFALPHPVDGITEMPHHVKLVEQDGGLRCVALGRVAERFPHVHH